MNLKITIPKPCHENWNVMTPDEKGRFCSQCAKSVVDFTAMPRTEVEDYLLANADKKICGRFNHSQVDNAPVTLHIPRQAIYRRHSFMNMFLLALVVSMGTTLFSCQNKTIGEIAMPGDTMQVDSTQSVTKQKDAVSPTHGANTIDTLKGAKFKPVVCTGVSIGDTIISTTPEPFLIGEPAIPDAPPAEKDVYNLSEVEARPQFPGGINKLYEYINSNLQYPESTEGENRRMFVSFIIEKDGSLGTIKVLRGFDESLNAEVIRKLKTSPRWVPAQIGKENVRVHYTLPINLKPKE